MVEPEPKTSWSYIRSGTSGFQISPDWEKRRPVDLFVGILVGKAFAPREYDGQVFGFRDKTTNGYSSAASKTIQFAKLSVQVLFGCLTCLILLDLCDVMIKVLQLFLFYRWEN